MSLTARLTLTGPDSAEDPEDYLAASLGVIFPDDVTNQHGDSEHGLLYTSPHLPKPIPISLADPVKGEDRELFSHYLWNSSLLLAELIEAGTLGLSSSSPPAGGGDGGDGGGEQLAPPPATFDVRGLETVELGAGTALPSLMGALLGARRVVVTDYPAEPVLKTLRENVGRVTGQAAAEYSPLGAAAREVEVRVEGHGWGELAGGGEAASFAADSRARFDRVMAADCLWMPWQHENLRRSIGWFLKEDAEARAWVVAGFHTGREKMRGFFEAEGLRKEGLEVERIWERDCDGRDRSWAWDRGVEDVSGRKRWLAIAVLRRVR